MFDCDEDEATRIASEMERMRARANGRTRAVWANFDECDEFECLESWSIEEALGPLARTIGR
jgi:hypothetical protein